ncbi:hypothetical protein Nepgr_000458 [Nepenthes gracilis]|uniref:Uncharacterized protein n=1 Tax=Nepenthes gracilis TaxID=150966 RepID=A0AAD3P310_NEPGR|nr:hypothetical protein Nepgr_000458 [Nepenthes gracilis]
MNDLFSSSFRKYTDLKHQALLDDLGAGGTAEKESVNLKKFFEDVENVKNDVGIVEKLYKQLEDASEECTMATNT